MRNARSDRLVESQTNSKNGPKRLMSGSREPGEQQKQAETLDEWLAGHTNGPTGKGVAVLRGGFAWRFVILPKNH